MIILGNPGAYEAPAAADSGSGIFFTVLLIAGAAFMIGVVVGAIAGIGADDGEVAVLVGFATFIVLVLIGGVIATFVDHGRTEAIETVQASAEAEYIDDVTDWLDSSFEINVTDDEASALVDGGELAVTVDGELVSIQFIAGQDETIQVRVVGGRVLQPNE